MYLRVVLPFVFEAETPAISSTVRCTTSTTTRRPVRPLFASLIQVLYPPLEPGDRVVRGPDWMWGNQDGNSEGTVVRRKEWKGMKDMGVWTEWGFDVGDRELGQRRKQRVPIRLRELLRRRGGQPDAERLLRSFRRVFGLCGELGSQRRMRRSVLESVRGALSVRKVDAWQARAASVPLEGTTRHASSRFRSSGACGRYSKPRSLTRRGLRREGAAVDREDRELRGDRVSLVFAKAEKAGQRVFAQSAEPSAAPLRSVSLSSLSSLASCGRHLLPAN